LSFRIDAAVRALRPPAEEVASPRGETTIVVRGVEVQADIGINAEEIGQLQPLIIHAELRVREPAADEIGSTFDYRDLVQHAEALASRRMSLIETFAHRLARVCLDHPAVLRVEIAVDKPAALRNGLAGVRVTLESE
jgi:dihydroneopterin aldolase